MSLIKKLEIRSNQSCELCSSNENLSEFLVIDNGQEDIENYVHCCQKCKKNLEQWSDWDVDHWRCLSESMWSEHLIVQILVYRVLISLGQAWANDLAEQIYFEEEALAIAKAGIPNTSDAIIHKDSNGTILKAGDTITLIKDLEVKGGGFTAKRGTTVKNIRLTDNPEHIEGRVNGTQIVLVTRFLKRVNE